jgi:23S rRNA pseudouridine1911/1915/1917 synthase
LFLSPTLTRQFTATAEDRGQRIDRFLAAHFSEEGAVSRARVHLLFEHEQVTVDGAVAKPSLKLRGAEHIVVTGDPRPAPLRAIAEQIPLDIVYEDKDLAVVNKPAGMMVHAGAGATEDERNQGTLVNALLGHFAKLSQSAGELRPGIVHRLDKQTSGLIVIAKNDKTHAALAEMFSQRRIRKTYVALVHGEVKEKAGTIDAAVSRDVVRRTRMTTRRAEGRAAVSHYRVLERIGSAEVGGYGKFTLVEVRIETGRTHQIRVHMSSIGHPVVGDSMYGAPHAIVKVRAVRKKKNVEEEMPLVLPRNFLHAQKLSFLHPSSGKQIDLEAPLPAELTSFVELLRLR